MLMQLLRDDGGIVAALRHIRDAQPGALIGKILARVQRRQQSFRYMEFGGDHLPWVVIGELRQLRHLVELTRDLRRERTGDVLRLDRVFAERRAAADLAQLFERRLIELSDL